MTDPFSRQGQIERMRVQQEQAQQLARTGFKIGAVGFAIIALINLVLLGLIIWGFVEFIQFLQRH